MSCEVGFQLMTNEGRMFFLHVSQRKTVSLLIFSAVFDIFLSTT